jgi:AcrR family transcriptional regulator
MTNSPSSAKRIRRTPEEARRVILDAAEASMAADGPAGIRLQDVAAAAGVSHPTILHHFGNRQGLLQALNQRTLEDLKTVLIASMSANAGSGEAMEATFAAYRNGLAQRILWLLQAPAGPGPSALPMFEEIVQTLHSLRVSLAGPGIAVNEFDSRAIVHLTTIAAFGDAIVGPRLRQASDADEEAASRRRFEAWFRLLINGFVVAKMRPADG